RCGAPTYQRFSGLWRDQKPDFIAAALRIELGNRALPVALQVETWGPFEGKRQRCDRAHAREAIGTHPSRRARYQIPAHPFDDQAKRFDDPRPPLALGSP